MLHKHNNYWMLPIIGKIRKKIIQNVRNGCLFSDKLFIEPFNGSFCSSIFLYHYCFFYHEFMA